MKAGSSIYRSLTRNHSEPMHPLSCPSSKVNDYLTIDCSKCDGPQDIGQLRCLRGCVRAISEAGEIDHIALARDVVIEYRGRSVVALQKMSTPLARYRMDGRGIPRKCSKCPIEPTRLIDRLFMNWPPTPQGELFRVPHHQCEGIRCVSCRNRTLAIMEAARKDLSALNLQLNQLGVKVLGASL